MGKKPIQCPDCRVKAGLPRYVVEIADFEAFGPSDELGHDGGVILYWVAEGIGFGTLTVRKVRNSENEPLLFQVDTEHRKYQFVEAVLDKFKETILGQLRT